MTLDESILEADEKFEFDGLTVLIDRMLLSGLGALKIDFIPDKGIVVERI